MELAIATAVLAIIGVAVTLIGLPFVDIIARFRPARTQRAPSDMIQQQAVVGAAAFTPLQMADSGQRWPSEVPRRKTAMDLLPWPSQTWEDNPFPASQTSLPQQEAARTARKAAPQPTREQARKAAVAAQATASRKSRKGAGQRPSPKGTRPRQGVARPSAPSPSPAPPTRPAAPQARTNAPSAEPDVSSQAILAIANDPSRGLASAVEYVREQTGWSFQRAAQHVAMALRNHN